MNNELVTAGNQLEQRRPGAVLNSFAGNEIELEPGLILVRDTPQPADRAAIETIASALAG